MQLISTAAYQKSFADSEHPGVSPVSVDVVLVYVAVTSVDLYRFVHTPMAFLRRRVCLGRLACDIFPFNLSNPAA